MNKNTNMTEEQKKAKRAEYAKRYYERLKAQKTGTKTTEKTAVAINSAVKANDKIASKLLRAKKTAVKKPSVETTGTSTKVDMKQATKIFDQITKSLKMVKSGTKDLSKILTEASRSQDIKYFNRVMNLFKRIGYVYDGDKVGISITGKVRTKTGKVETADKPKRKYAKKTMVTPAEEVIVVETNDDQSEPVMPALEVQEPPVDEDEVNADEIIEVEEGGPKENEDVEDDCFVDLRDRDLNDDEIDNLHEMEEAMQDNGDWEN